MLIVAIKPGHDGAVAVVEDNRLIYSIEAEKDSSPRYAELSGNRMLEIAQLLDRPPDVLAVGGWLKGSGRKEIGAGYRGTDTVHTRDVAYFGQKMSYFSSSHERSHLMMAMGMAPAGEAAPLSAVLVWEGDLGAFYLLDSAWQVIEKIDVMAQPGDRYAFLFDLADPGFVEPRYPRLSSSGKLMALAAYGQARTGDAGPEVVELVERILTPRSRRISTATKYDFADSPLFNVGVEHELTKTAAVLLGERIFDAFARAAVEFIPPGIPLRISGGCGLNCDWNRRWRDLGHFSSVFVPPCTNDSGSAIGTAIDAARHLTGTGTLDWSVYSGLPFEVDTVPEEQSWKREPLDHARVAQRILDGEVTAWVQGASEIGPRALGNRSLLASPFTEATRDKLNEIKQREGYRPIAPCCRTEDLHLLFDETFPDPHMLYFRRVISGTIPAVTHVDGTARVQTVSVGDNAPLHRLLSCIARLAGVGVLCNTSLNWPGLGFINRLSDLVRYCERTGIGQIVAGDVCYTRPVEHR